VQPRQLAADGAPAHVPAVVEDYVGDHVGDGPPPSGPAKQVSFERAPERLNSPRLTSPLFPGLGPPA
jgi:hypothetical protein